MGSLGAGIGDGENQAPVLMLQIKAPMLDCRLKEIGIRVPGGAEESVPGKRRTGEHGGGEIWE